jgi:hypothetical protein
MGKRNKILKSGLSKKNFQNVLQSKKNDKSVLLNKTYNTINTNNIKNPKFLEKNEDEDQDMSVDNLNKTTTRDLNKTLLNEDAVERQSKLFGIEKEKLRTFLENPMRHRRQITKVVLSKGQKRRLEKKEKFKKKKELIEKIKLNQSMIINNTMNKSLNITKNLESGKNDNFNLNDFNHTLHNLMDEISENKKNEISRASEGKSKNTKNAKKLKNILNAEKEKIKKVIENKNYQANPMEAMKFHIKNSIVQQERKKKIEENYQKNYNFLNLNK